MGYGEGLVEGVGVGLELLAGGFPVAIAVGPFDVS